MPSAARCDVLVIGGGLTGCAAAFHLSRGGASVLLIEQGQINSGASGQNAGSLHFQLERRMFERAGSIDETAVRNLRLNRVAIDAWRGLEALLGRDLEVAMDGGLMVAETSEQMELLRRKAAIEDAHGLRIELLDGAEARRRAPYLSDSIIGAAFSPDEGHAGPRAVTAAYARAAEQAGAEMATQARAVAIRRAGSGFEVEIAQAGARPQAVRAEAILVAAGAWSAEVGQLANLHLPLFPVGLTMSVTEARPPIVPHLVQHVGRRLSLKQTHAGNLLIGGGHPSRLALRSAPPFGFDLEKPAILQMERLRENLRVAASVAPVVASLDLLRTWTGVVAITHDHLPILGPVAEAPGLFVAAGGSGFTLGPVLARLVSEQILTGQPSEDIGHFSPARFGALNGFMGL